MITQYRKGDAAMVCPQAIQANEAEEFAVFFDTIKAYSLVDDKTGAVEAVFGFMQTDKITAEGFALLSKMSVKKLCQLLRFLKNIIPQTMAELCVETLRITVRKNFDAGYKFASLLGFVSVAELPNFYDGEDYQLFERRKV